MNKDWVSGLGAGYMIASLNYEVFWKAMLGGFGVMLGAGTIIIGIDLFHHWKRRNPA